MRAAPAQGLRGCELVRLYVQPQAQRRGVGTALLQRAEALGVEAGAPHLWVAVWDGNGRARDFYARRGYAERGTTVHAFEGRAYGNRVVARPLSAGLNGAP